MRPASKRLEENLSAMWSRTDLLEDEKASLEVSLQKTEEELETGAKKADPDLACKTLSCIFV